MMNAAGITAVALLYILPIAFGLLILWWLIRSAVRRALRDHELWLESRPSAPIEHPDTK
jgi:hypothetical protein